MGRRRARDDYELSRHALRALCRGTVSGAVAPRELTSWGWRRFQQGGNRETALVYDLYLLDEDYARWDEGRARRLRSRENTHQTAAIAQLRVEMVGRDLGRAIQ